MAPAPEFFEWTHFCSILFFQSNWRTKIIFFIERTQFYSFVARWSKTQSAVQEVAIQLIEVDPLFLIPWGTCVMRSQY